MPLFTELFGGIGGIDTAIWGEVEILECSLDTELRALTAIFRSKKYINRDHREEVKEKIKHALMYLIL